MTLKRSSHWSIHRPKARLKRPNGAASLWFSAVVAPHRRTRAQWAPRLSGRSACGTPPSPLSDVLEPVTRRQNETPTRARPLRVCEAVMQVAGFLFGLEKMLTR